MMAGSMRDVTRFGAPLGDYRPGSARIWYGVGAVILIALGAVLALSAIGSSDAGSMVLLAIFALALAGLGVYLIVLAFRSIGTTVQLFEGGFNATQHGKTTVAAWGDVASITQQIIRHRYRGIPIWTSHSYRLELANGEKLRFTETIGKISEMGEKMQRQITHTLTPRALEALRAGASLPFGKLSINPLGISNGSETLPWGQISNVTIQNGSIIIGKAGKRLRWTSTPVSKTPNAYIFLSLVDIMRRGGQQVPQQAPR